MGALTLTAGAYPVILSENYLNRYAFDADDIVASDGQDFVHRLYDGVPSAVWTTLESSDGDTESITFGLYVEGAQTARSIDFFALLNHNLKAFVVEFSANNGASYNASYTKTYTDEASANTLISFATPFDCNKIRITMTRTQGGSPVNEQKQIGQVVVALAQYQMTRGMRVYEASKDPQVKVAKLADGSERYAHIYRADDGFQFYDAHVEFIGCTKAERDAIRAIRDGADPFLWVPEPGDEPGEIFLCRMKVDTYRDAYVENIRGAYQLAFDVHEVGGS